VGGAGVVVHNGRYIGPGLMDVLFEIPADAHDKFLAAHLHAPLVLSRLLVPGMVDRGSGTVVTITSTSAYTVPPAPAGKGGWGHEYAVAKAAGHQLVPTAARGVRRPRPALLQGRPGIRGARNEIVVRDFGQDISRATKPAVIGQVVSWLVTLPKADALVAETVDAQELARTRGLLPH
jgi:NAD(P)-dependent dehydrogenase (short-subunit alcohol dehydrogenase family)